MSDSSLLSFLDLVRQELGAEDAFVQLGGKSPEGEGRLVHAIGDSSHVVLVFAEPPPDVAARRERLGLLSTAFQKTLDAAVAEVASPRHAVDGVQHRLDEALTALAERAGALRAFVFDLDSPMVWGASSIGRDDAEEAPSLLDRAVLGLKQKAGEVELAQDHTRRFALDDEIEALVRPFAGLYVLALLFRGPVSEPLALGAMLHAAGPIEKLVLSLPPIDPTPGAKVIRLSRNK